MNHAVCVQLEPDLARLCARICARTDSLLPAIHAFTRYWQNSRYCLVKTLRFETESDALKSMISQS